MISNILFNNIYDFVSRIGVTDETQIYTMFGGVHGDETIRWCIKELLRKNKINMDRETGVITRRQSVSEDDFGQKLLTKAAWILAYMGETRVRDYMPIRYPSQMLKAILQAVKDYRRAVHNEKMGVVKECERFFTGKWLEVLTTLPGTVILEKLRQEDGKNPKKPKKQAEKGKRGRPRKKE